MTEQQSQSAIFGLFARDLIANGTTLRFSARGRSMLPTIQDGEFVHVMPLTGRPKLGSIVLFLGDEGFKAHRVVAKQVSKFTTRGDAGMKEDGSIDVDQIVGTIVAKECAMTGRIIPLDGVLPRGKYFSREIVRRARALVNHVTLSRTITAVILALITFLLPRAAQGQGGGVALDNVNSQGFTVGSNGSTCTATPTGQNTFWSCQFTHTDNFGGANSNTLLAVGVSMNLVANADSSVQAMTCNGISMTLGPNVTANNLRSQIFYLANPPLGTCTIQAAVRKSGGAGNPIGMVIGAISVYRVNTSAAITSVQGSGTGTTASLSFANTGTNDGILDVLATTSSIAVTANTSATSPLVPEIQQWNQTSGASGQDVEATGSSGGGTGAAVTMQETLSASANWTMAAIEIPALNPTAVKTNSFSANAAGGEVHLSWKTGSETHNLGFNVYRDTGGIRTKLNPSLITGSALLMRDAQPQHGAKSYSWIDPQPVPGALYWLEDMDLDGAREMHGPISVGFVPSAAPVWSRNAAVALPRPQSNARVLAATINSFQAHVQERIARPTVSSQSQQTGYQLAARPAIKILVDHEGWYRVTQPQLVSAGLRANTNINFLHLYAEGVEQPIRIVGARGVFGSGAAIEFYGTGIDTPYSGQRVYWLVEQPKPGLRVPETSATGTLASTAPSFMQTLELKPRTTYFAALLRENTDNFFGPLVSPTPDVETLDVANLASGEATLKVILQGVTDGQQHDVTVMLNGATLGEVTFVNQQEGSAEFAVPGGILVNGTNVLTLTAQQGSNDISLVDAITLSFPHTYTAESDQLKFTANPGETISIAGFTQPPSRLVDITNPTHPLLLRFFSSAQNGSYVLQSGIPWTENGRRTLLALADTQLRTPVALLNHKPTSLHTSQPGAEFVIVTAPQFGAETQPLAALHQSQGQSSAVVSVNDIYDEFNFGEPSPYAIKAFLKTATVMWTAKPKYLVLAGDASVDPRNYLGFGFFDFVPTKIVVTSELKTASDDWFSDFNNTGFATIATGRLPARTSADAQLMVSKIVGYANNGAAPWNENALLVADTDDPGLSFTQAAQAIKHLLPSTMVVNEVFQGVLGSTARQTLVDEITRGQALVNYNGHGSVQIWSSNLFDDTMASALTNGPKLPLFVIMNCLNGFFHDVYTQSLAESLMLAPNGGGVAVWASSGLTNAAPQFQMDDSFTKALFSQPATAVGDAILVAKSGIADADVRRTFIFFGDPAMKLNVPNWHAVSSNAAQANTTATSQNNTAVP